MNHPLIDNNGLKPLSIHILEITENTGTVKLQKDNFSTFTGEINSLVDIPPFFGYVLGEPLEVFIVTNRGVSEVDDILIRELHNGCFIFSKNANNVIFSRVELGDETGKEALDRLTAALDTIADI